MPRFGRCAGIISSVVFANAIVQSPVTTVQAQVEDPSEATFLDAASDAQATSQGTIDLAIAAIDRECIRVEIAACLTDVVAVHLPAVVDEYAGYADRLESLPTPESLSHDVSLHVEMLRSVSASLKEIVRAAGSGDPSRIPELTDRIVEAHADLAGRLDPEYGSVAFVSPFVGLPNTPFERIDFGVLMGPTAEARAYLDAVREATERLVDRERCYGGTLRDGSDTTAERLARLSECGAGTTYPLILQQARLLEPPPRFADEHAWWLATLEATSRHDRSSREAIQANDFPAFLADTIRIGIATRPYDGFDPAFGAAAYPPVARLGSAPDPAAAVTHTPYGRALFSGLLAYWGADPHFHAMLPLDVPGLEEDVALAAIVDATPDLRAAQDDLLEVLVRSEPPASFAVDHESLIGFFRREGDRLEAYLTAARAGDMSGVRSAWVGGLQDYCATVQARSDAIRPVTDVYFAGLACS
jgi:hypothetical protein